jgi:hypothetical protein
VRRWQAILMSETATYSEYAFIRAMLLSICHVRPDTSAFVSIVLSTAAETYYVNKDVKISNEQIVFLKRTSNVGLHCPRQDYDSLQLDCYIDASFANRADKSRQIGFVTCLLDKNGAMRIVSFLSCKAWRVCRSGMASETLAFVKGLDSTLSRRSQLSQMLERDMPILMLTDSQSLFNVMTTQ